MDEEFKDLQRLLRLKRYEAPPPEYFEDFLVEFHRRQRAELLKRPVWRLMLDRIEGAIPTFSPARYAYAGACATAVAAAVLASGHLLTPGSVRTAVASVGAPVTARTVSAPFHAPLPAGPMVRPQLVSNPPLDIYSSRKQRVRIAPELDFDRPRPMTAAYTSSRPRYVLDTQPVSYEQPFSF